jgi:putative component of toxin-antitoxin plasmid stabilization module
MSVPDIACITERAGVFIILLAGGDKSSQTKDIQRAISLVKGLQEQEHG